jgi:hypothetical protein
VASVIGPIGIVAVVILALIVLSIVLLLVSQRSLA